MRISDWSSDVCSSDLLPVDEGALGAERRTARIAEYAVEVAAFGRQLRIGIEDVVGAQRERPAITVVINGRVEDPFGRVDVVVEIAGRTVFGHASVAQGGADEFPVVLLVCIGPDELGTGRSEEHTSELQSLMRNSYAVFCLKKN